MQCRCAVQDAWRSGNDIGIVAGNYKINKAFGNKKDIKSLTKYCAENGVNLFMNRIFPDLMNCVITVSTASEPVMPL